MEITQDQIHGEGNWATIKRQCLYDSHILALCHVAVLNAWSIIEGVREKIESFSKVIQCPRETFIDFLQILTSSVNRIIPNSEARQIIIESLTFEMASSLLDPSNTN